MARVIKPPAPFAPFLTQRSVFLAGSIAMGEAAAWQAQVESALQDYPLLILNPRRDDWDSSWRQAIDEPRFREQVEWELAGQQAADLIAMYFDPATYAPITLLELGLFAASGKLIVCCPDGFWRKGNVDIVCARYGITQVADLQGLVGAVIARL